MGVFRDRGGVLCGHCTREVARQTCPGCQREVCASCAADFASCPSPRSFEYRLGVGSRLRLISMRGQLGVISGLTQRLRLVDLPGHRVLERAGWLVRWNRAMKRVGGISAAGELLSPRGYRLLANGSVYADSLWLVDAVIELELRVSTACFDRSESVLLATTADERVMILELAPPAERARRPIAGARLVEPLSRRVLQAIDGDLASGVIAAATHGEIGVVRLEADGPQTLGVSPTGDLDTAWVGVAGDRVAVIIGDRGGFASLFAEHVLQVREVSSTLEPIYSATHRRGGMLQRDGVADISDDGRFVAVALASREIAVHDIDRGGVQRLAGHTDRIASLRFGPGAAFLVSGDLDNRVIVWFRGPSGFGETLERAALRDPD